MKINRSAANLGLPEEGIHFAEIRHAEEKFSRAGDQMLVIDLVSVDTGEKLLTHFIMLEGKGAKFGMRSIKGLGIRDDQTDVDTSDLVGRRVYVCVEHGEYQGEAQAGVKTFAEGSHGGYWTEDSPPEGYTPPAVVIKEETPF